MPSALEPLMEPNEASIGPEVTKTDSMNDSVTTSPTDAGSISEEEAAGNGWLGSFAKSIKNNVPAAIEGVANLVHRSAMTVAAEIAQLEREAELEAERWREENYGNSGVGADYDLHLPWEMETDEEIKEDNALKVKIMALSHNESTFRGPYDVANDSGEDTVRGFTLDEPHIHLIRRLLELDENLATTHAKLSGRSDVKETVFWRNYFYHCERLQREHAAEIGVALDVYHSPLSDSLLSLIPANSEHGSDTSYVNVRRNSIASPPSSLNTTLSIGDVVVVGPNRGRINYSFDENDEGHESS